MNSSLYIHIPYCASKCIYCDFFSGGAKYADWDLFVRQLLAELTARKGELTDNVTTIYLGGGTPSQIPESQLKYLLENIRLILGRSLSSDAEITMEVNPEDVTIPRAHFWKNLGINRISVGIQTFNNKLLSGIGRKHSGEDAENSLHILTDIFSNVSADLIFGLPGQSCDDFMHDLKVLTRYKTQHLSCYSLMIEEGTALHELIRQKRVTINEESISDRMYQYLVTTLSALGFDHYEISNFALPGYRSKHNSGYWSGRPYLGIGPAAHSYDGERIRRSNPWNLKGYLRHNFEVTQFYDREVLNDEEVREEFIMLSMRTREGLDLREYSQKFGTKSLKKLHDAADRDISNGLLILNEDRLSLSEEGIMIADSVISNLF